MKKQNRIIAIFIVFTILVLILFSETGNSVTNINEGFAGKVNLNVSVDETIIPTGSIWKYLDDGSDQGTAWREIGFNDSSWSSGQAELGYGDGDEVTVVSYGPSSRNKYITTYFRHTFDLNDLPSDPYLRILLKRDDGAVVYINGTQVVRAVMPDDTISYLTPALTGVSGADEAKFYDYYSNSSLLRVGKNVIAVEIHQVNKRNNDISFDLSLQTVEVLPPPALDFRKKPYLIYEGDNTKYALLWQLKSEDTCLVEWGVDTNYTLCSAITSEYGNDHQHKFVFSGLTPGQKYYYRVNNFRGSFYAAPDTGIKSIKFLAYGDTRSYPGAHNKVASQILKLINTDSAYQTFIINAGDLVSDGDYENIWDEEFFNAQYTSIRTMMSQLGYQAVRGNHEESGVLYKKYFPYPYQVNGAMYWSFDYGPVHVAVLDYYDDFSNNSAQINWLKRDLSNTNKPWKFITLHRPGWSAGGHSNKKLVQDVIQPICLQYDVKVVFAGHNHYYARAVVDGVHHITTGGGGAPLYTPDASYPHIVSVAKALHFCKIDINDKTMHVSVIDAGGIELDNFSVTLDATGIDAACIKKNLPQSYHLYPACPNPFNSRILIEFYLPKAGEILVAVYDANGKKVTTLTNSHYPAGKHSLKWNAKSVSSGTYFVRLQAGTFSKTRKIQLIK